MTALRLHRLMELNLVRGSILLFSKLVKSVGKIYKVTGEQNLLQVPDSELLETPLKSAALVSALGMWVEKIIMTLLLI